MVVLEAAWLLNPQQLSQCSRSPILPPPPNLEHEQISSLVSRYLLAHPSLAQDTPSSRSTSRCASSWALTTVSSHTRPVLSYLRVCGPPLPSLSSLRPPSLLHIDSTRTGRDFTLYRLWLGTNAVCPSPAIPSTAPIIRLSSLRMLAPSTPSAVLFVISPSFLDNHDYANLTLRQQRPPLLRPEIYASNFRTALI